MSRRLEGKIAVVVGAGQSPGATIGNGKATALLFAREGASVLAVDSNPDRARKTAEDIVDAGGTAHPFTADVTQEEDMRAMVNEAVTRWGRLDILHNNVGVSVAGGDAPITEITVEAFDRVVAINLRGMVLACKHAIPIMRDQNSGVITMISSLGGSIRYPYVGYTTSKAAVTQLARHVAIDSAQYGIRANAILPGLMETPMAVETRVDAVGVDRAALVAERNARVPLRNRMGTAWDVAHASLFLASDEAGFITGVSLPVDGGHALAVS